MLFAQVVETENGFAIELLNNAREHMDWFKKSDGSVKTWRFAEQAQRVMENNPAWCRVHW